MEEYPFELYLQSIQKLNKHLMIMNLLDEKIEVENNLSTRFLELLTSTSRKQTNNILQYIYLNINKEKDLELAFQ